MTNNFLGALGAVCALGLSLTLGVPTYGQSQQFTADPKGPRLQQSRSTQISGQVTKDRVLPVISHRIPFAQGRIIGPRLARQMIGKRDIDRVNDCSYVEIREGEVRGADELFSLNLKQVKRCMMFVDRTRYETNTYFVSNVPCVESGPQDMRCFGGFKTFAHINTTIEPLSGWQDPNFASTRWTFDIDPYPTRSIAGQSPRLQRSLFLRFQGTYRAELGAIILTEQRLSRTNQPIGKPVSRNIYTPQPVPYAAGSDPAGCEALEESFKSGTHAVSNAYFDFQRYAGAYPIMAVLNRYTRISIKGGMLRRGTMAAVNGYLSTGNWMFNAMLSLEAQALETACRLKYQNLYNQDGPDIPFDPDRPDDPVPVGGLCVVCTDWAVVRGPDRVRQIDAEDDEAEAWEVTAGEPKLTCVRHTVVEC